MTNANKLPQVSAAELNHRLDAAATRLFHAYDEAEVLMHRKLEQVKAGTHDEILIRELVYLLRSQRSLSCEVASIFRQLLELPK